MKEEKGSEILPHPWTPHVRTVQGTLPFRGKPSAPLLSPREWSGQSLTNRALTWPRLGLPILPSVLPHLQRVCLAWGKHSTGYSQAIAQKGFANKLPVWFPMNHHSLCGLSGCLGIMVQSLTPTFMQTSLAEGQRCLKTKIHCSMEHLPHAVERAPPPPSRPLPDSFVKGMVPTGQRLGTLLSFALSQGIVSYFFSCHFRCIALTG